MKFHLSSNRIEFGPKTFFSSEKLKKKMIDLYDIFSLAQTVLENSVTYHINHALKIGSPLEEPRNLSLRYATFANYDTRTRCK